MWRLVPKILQKRYEAFVADCPETSPVIGLVRAALVNMLKLCPASSRNGDGAERLRITEEAEETR
jgi:hypothetical protein